MHSWTKSDISPVKIHCDDNVELIINAYFWVYSLNRIQFIPALGSFPPLFIFFLKAYSRKYGTAAVIPQQTSPLTEF
jgi:hypothetical protein